MTVLRAESEQKFSKVLRSRAATAHRGTTRALDPHPERRSEQDGRSPPRTHPGLVPASHIALEGWSARRRRQAPPTAGTAIAGELSDAGPRPAVRVL